MAAIRHSLQKEVFQPLDERLLSVCHVSKLLKKKKTSFLCIVTTVKPPITISICQVKKNDKNVFKKKRFWLLSDLKILDGRNVDNDTHEFDIYFDKTYRWLASSPQERQNFFITLWKQCCKHLPKQKPEFRNVPETWISEIVLSPESVVAIPIDNNIENIESNEDFQAITDIEQNELSKLIESCDFAVSDAEKFMEVLAKDLSILDGQNVQIILASEKKVEQFMMQLELAEKEAELIESRLAMYDEILCNVRESMQSVENKNALIAIAHQNNIRLLTEMENLISQLDLPNHHQIALDEPELTTAKGLAAAIAAGKALRAAMNCSLQPALLKLAAIREQRKRFERWHAKFSKTISRHLNNLFIHLGNDMGENLSFHANELTLPQHNSVHKELIPYTDLMHWMKAMDNKAYNALRKVYENSLGKLYERDIKKFFEEAKQHVSGGKRGKSGSGSKEDLTTISSSVSRLRLTTSNKPIAEGPLLGIEREQWPPQSIDVDQAERQRCDAVLERALAELEPVCLKEQQFCVTFFQLDVLSPTSKNTETTLYETLGRAEIPAIVNTTTVIPQKRIEKQINEDVRRMMGELFACLEPELNNFIAHYEKLDSFYCMNVFVRLSQHVMSAQDTGSFLSMTFASVLVQVKRNFDEFMKAQKTSIENTKVNRKTKCGILPYVQNFEEFAKTAESIFKAYRRPDIEKWYLQLVTKMFEMIPIHASDHHKTPQEVVKMENFHHLYALLSQLKISVLDSLRKDAKQKYNDALKAYVIQYFGRPLEKLNLFFEGVQAKVSQGVKESEIGYQLAFSKQELRKVIQQYPAREVKKGLESLYRKVEKHLSEEENLLQVVWRAMQEEFIMQYKNLEDLIQHCYPGSMISLDFTIEDLLEFFSEIARSH